MSALSRDDVAHVASLARIDLTDAELDRLAGQLDQIVGWVQQVGWEPVDRRQLGRVRRSGV